MGRRDTFCSHCGQRFADTSAYPRACSGCGTLTFANPKPVAVVIQPVGEGVLVETRAIAPAGPAFPSGYMEEGETWDQSAARELREETGIRTDPADISPLMLPPCAARLSLFTAPNATMLIFMEAPRLLERDLPPFSPNAEVSGCFVAYSPETLCFQSHTAVMKAWFAHRQVRDLRLRGVLDDGDGFLTLGARIAAARGRIGAGPETEVVVSRSAETGAWEIFAGRRV